MLISRVVLSRASRSVGRRSLLLLSPSQKQQLPIFSNQIESLVHVNSNQVSLFHHSAFSSSPFQRFGFTSSASPEANEKEGSTAENNADSTNVEPETSNGDTKPSNETREPGFKSESQPNISESTKRRRRGTKRTAFSDSDSDTEGDLSMDDLVKLVAEKEELLKLKHKEIEKMQDKVLRTYAEMENVMERTKREAENSRKFAIQNFAKGLLDVADNLGRASSVVKDSYSKIDTSTDTAGAVPLLKTLLEGVEMTEKQLAEVFRKSGVEKYDPRDEPFDPHRHNAVFEVPDSSKPPGTVAVVLKAGYLLHDRVIRPAEVGVTKEVENDTASNN
ncbi:grpE protein homolog 2, mitochondrial isoform X2 [Ricinus communis]|uniref:grpE protein homolog 2, mitochondrial isoform X2 n=1 Tax=Ricinus communis TaxID=3988 RepID=UPI00077292A2|nr:grpE protein homolog 2, mitochondrial isoform X2 [Ricinus communis]